MLLLQGSYVFVRRLDDQVKVNGYRIELAEVEFAYEQHNTVAQAVAVVDDGALLVFVKPAEGITAGLTAADLKSIGELVKRFLPVYMIPRCCSTLFLFPCLFC